MNSSSEYFTVAMDALLKDPGKEAGNARFGVNQIAVSGIMVLAYIDVKKEGTDGSVPVQLVCRG